MVTMSVLIALILVLVTATGRMSVRYAPSSTIPTNEDYLKDESSETCTTFKNSENTSIQQHTQFRIKAFAADVGDINVTIVGSNLKCGRQLYVSPLSPVMANAWIGRLSSCQLVKTVATEKYEDCSYWCKSPLHSKEIQILRLPQTPDNEQWEVCEINITVNSAVYYGCSEALGAHSGVYQIKLPNTENYTEVYCDQETNGGDWTVLMRREDGSVSFNREWEDCKYMFGSFNGEFWAGNEIMHRITTDGRTYLLRVELRSFTGEYIYAEYSNFSIGFESDNYRLHVSGYLPSSTAGDSLGYHNGMMFSTASRDNDNSSVHCAQEYGVSWWFNACQLALLTAPYGDYPDVRWGIRWMYPWGNQKFASYVRMMIRPLK